MSKRHARTGGKLRDYISKTGRTSKKLYKRCLHGCRSHFVVARRSLVWFTGEVVGWVGGWSRVDKILPDQINSRQASENR